MANGLSDALRAWGFRPALETTPLAVRIPRTFRVVEDELLVVGDDEGRTLVAARSLLTLQELLRIAAVFNAFDLRPLAGLSLNEIYPVHKAA